MTRYKKQKWKEILISSLCAIFGATLLEFTAIPALGALFLIFGSFWCFYAFIYLVGEYEEDEANSQGLFNFNAGKIDSDKHRRG